MTLLIVLHNFLVHGMETDINVWKHCLALDICAEASLRRSRGDACAIVVAKTGYFFCFQCS